MAVGSTEQLLEEGRLNRAVAGEMREVAAGSGRGRLDAERGLLGVVWKAIDSRLVGRFVRGRPDVRVAWGPRSRRGVRRRWRRRSKLTHGIAMGLG